MKKSLFIVFVIISFVLLASVSAIAITESSRADKYETQYENELKSSLSQSVNTMQTIESDLSKLMITSNRREEMLSSIALKSAGCSDNLSALPIVSTNAQNVLKFTNQLASYCTSVLNQDSLPENFDEQIYSFFETSQSVNKELSVLENQILAGELDILSVGNEESETDGMFGSVTESIIEYPSVIFDGPFSDGQESTTPKVLREEISQEEASEKVKQLGFNAEYTGEINGVIPAYCFKGDNVSIQITKNGGLLLSALSDRAVLKKNISVEDGLNFATEFAEKLNIGETKAVWQENYGNYAIYNFTTASDGVAFYPDIFKIKIALDTGEVLSFEGKSFIINNHSRSVAQPKVTAEECAKKLKDGFVVSSSGQCVISVNRQEKSAWEFFGEYMDMKFAVYYSVEDGEELTSFRIIGTDSGEKAS